MDAPAGNTGSSKPGAGPQTVRGLAFGGIVLLGVILVQGYSPWTSPDPPRRMGTLQQVDLNTADRVEIAQVPGVGVHLAEAIVLHREKNGRFGTVEELTQVHGVGPRTLDQLRPWFRVDANIRDVITHETDLLQKLERTPSPPDAGSVRSSTKIRPGEPKIHVNTAGVEELMRLPGVGKVIAERIIDARGDGYTGIDELSRVRGIGKKTLENIRPFVTIDPQK